MQNDNVKPKTKHKKKDAIHTYPTDQTSKMSECKIVDEPTIVSDYVSSPENVKSLKSFSSNKSLDISNKDITNFNIYKN